MFAQACTRLAGIRVPWGLLGMLGLALGCERYIAQHEFVFTNVFAATAKWTGQAARRAAPGNDVLCLGDSLVKDGLLPLIMEKTAGLRAFNLAIVGGQPPGSYVLLRRALEAGARPAAVVVDFQPGMLAAHPKENLRQWPEIMSLWQLAELGWNTGDRSFASSLILSELLPSYKVRHDLREKVLIALGAKEAINPLTIPAFLRNENINQGGFAMPKDAKWRMAAELDGRDGAWATSWYADPTNGRYVRRLLKLTAARKIPVFWLLPPISPLLQSKRDQKGLEQLYLVHVKSMQRQFSNLLIIDGRHAGYTGAVFYDTWHLDHQGASALSAGVARTLHAYLAEGHRPASGWYTLPAYRDEPADSELEDVSHSGIAVGTRDVVPARVLR